MNLSTREQGLTVEYQDVVPSTDLPPHIKGKPQCFLCVTIGKLTWRGSACSLYKLPLPSSTYIRLKWWGDSSKGTYFRPEIEKYARVIRGRAQFCVRSKPQQIANYFKDMGSATFDVLPSPNSLPIGRVLVPAVVSLSFDCTVRGSFPVKTASANIIGQLQVSMSFKVKRCDCDDLNFEAVGKEQSLYCKPLPRKTYIINGQQLQCPLENRISRFNKSRNFGSPYDSPNNKGSSCYPKLSATGRYGSRRCVCSKLYNCGCGCADEIKNAAYCPLIPPFDRIECNTSCPLMDPTVEPCNCLKNESTDLCQAETVNELIESTRELNRELVRTLRQERRENKDLVQNLIGNTGCRMQNVNLARVTVRSLQLNCEAIIDDISSQEECVFDSRRKCPVDSFDLGKDGIIASEVGCIRLDHKAVFDIEVNPAMMQSWQTESINFLVFRKEFRCDEMSILGTGRLPLWPVINSVGSSYFACVPVRSVDCQFSEPPTCASLQVVIDLICCDKNNRHCFTPATSSNVCPLSASRNKSFKNEIECKYKKCGKEKSSRLRNLVADFCVATENNLWGCSEDECPFPNWDFLYLFIYLEKAKNIPAARMQGENSNSKCFKPNVYLVCRALPAEESSTTCTAWNTHDPSFCYAEMIPVRINSGMLKRFKKDSIVVEVWTKVPSPSKADDRLLGVVKIPLAVFYESLNNSDTARTSFESDCPMIATDGYQPIVDVFSNQERGKLKLAVALGTLDQINRFRRCREADDVTESIACKTEEKVICDVKKDDEICVETTRTPITEQDRKESPPDNDDYTKHVIMLIIENIEGFDSCSVQLGGTKQCYLQYQFLTYASADQSPDSDEFCCLDYSLQTFSTSTFLWSTDLQWNFTNKHTLILPSDVSLIKFLQKSLSKVPCSGSEIQFKLFGSSGCRRKSNKLIAKGSLPVSKLSSALSISGNEKSQTSFTIPLQFLKQCEKLAGKLKLTMRYKRCCLKKSKLQKYNDVQLKFELTEAHGLKTAAHLPQDKRLQDGINSYATILPSFLPNPTTYESELIKNSFSPQYNFVIQEQCPVLFQDDEKKVKSLAEMLANGFIEIQVFQKFTDENTQCDILLGQTKVPTKFLLYKLSGHSGWYQLSNPSHQTQASDAGNVYVSMGFSCKEALLLTLHGAQEAQWSPPPTLSSLIHIDSSDNLKPADTLNINQDVVTFRLTVTNAWIPKKLIISPDEVSKDSDTDQKSYIYMRYKFHDQDTVMSKPCLTSSKCKRLEKDYCSAKLVHQKTFLCQPTKFFVWYLREEMFKMQIFFTKNRAGKSKKKRMEEDLFLGSVDIDMSSLLSGGPQHISGIYTLFNRDNTDADAASIQVSLSLVPGNDLKSYEEEMSDYNVSSSEDEGEDEVEKKKKEAQDAKNTFTAIVSVERALYLAFIPPAPVLKNEDLLGANYYVTFPVADDKAMHKTKVVVKSSCPVWNDANEVRLNRKIFDDDGGKITFRIWQSDMIESSSRDRVVGFATVDISLLKNGFPAVSGWYNVLNAFGKCQGEIKLAVTPTEPRQIFDEKSSYFVPAKGIFNSTPLLCPVRSPLGGVYCPTLTNPIHPNMEDVMSLRHLAPGAFDAEHNAKMRTALLEQIKQLEQIRCDLHEKFVKSNRIWSLNGSLDSHITSSTIEESTTSSTELSSSETSDVTSTFPSPKPPQNEAVMPSGCSEETESEGKLEVAVMKRKKNTSVSGKHSGGNGSFTISKSTIEVNEIEGRDNRRRSISSFTFVSRSNGAGSKPRDHAESSNTARIESRDSAGFQSIPTIDKLRKLNAAASDEDSELLIDLDEIVASPFKSFPGLLQPTPSPDFFSVPSKRDARL